MSYKKQIQILIEEYRRNIQDGRLNAREIAGWMLREGKCAPSRQEAITVLTRHVSEAMRAQMTTDPDGRRVRRKHAVRYKETNPDGTKTQMTFWYDKDIAPPQFMYESFQQRRGAITDDCWQLKLDLDSYNKFNNKGAPFQILLNFVEDMEERELDRISKPIQEVDSEEPDFQEE